MATQDPVFGLPVPLSDEWEVTGITESPAESPDAALDDSLARVALIQPQGKIGQQRR